MFCIAGAAEARNTIHPIGIVSTVDVQSARCQRGIAPVARDGAPKAKAPR
jgi:hypothetical protein